MSFFVAQLLNGILIGTFFSLVALGYTVVYGVLRLINFAHGPTYMLGAFLGMALLGVMPLKSAGLNIAGTILVVGILCGCLGIITERIAYRPLRRQPLLIVMLAALGIGYIIENGVLVIPGWGSKPHAYPASFPAGGWNYGLFSVQYSHAIIFLIALSLFFALHFFVSRSIHGKAMRAIAVDRDTAALMGVNIDRVLMITFFISAGIAGVTGVLAGLYYQTIHFQMGFNMGIVAFTAAVLGGIGNIPGAVVGGLVLGMVQSFGTGYLGSEWQDLFSFVVLVAVLSLRPHGLLGEAVGVRA